MKYVALILICLSTIYTFSYAKSNWDEKNRLGAAGAVIMATATIILSVSVLFFKS